MRPMTSAHCAPSSQVTKTFFSWASWLARLTIADCVGGPRHASLALLPP
jgi:hypothetical protein